MYDDPTSAAEVLANAREQRRTLFFRNLATSLPLGYAFGRLRHRADPSLAKRDLERSVAVFLVGQLSYEALHVGLTKVVERLSPTDLDLDEDLDQDDDEPLFENEPEEIEPSTALKIKVADTVLYTLGISAGSLLGVYLKDRSPRKVAKWAAVYGALYGTVALAAGGAYAVYRLKVRHEAPDDSSSMAASTTRSAFDAWRLAHTASAADLDDIAAQRAARAGFVSPLGPDQDGDDEDDDEVDPS
jgi:hypothetical protein